MSRFTIRTSTIFRTFRLGRLLFGLILTFQAALAFGLGPYDDIIVEEFWCDLEPMVQTGDEFPIPRDVALENLLEEARYVFSGMIFGFSFDYTPSDKIRSVEEQFTLRPIARIPWGDKQLSVVDTRREDKQLIARIRYDIAEYQKPWVSLWQGSSIPTATARGTGNVLKGFEEKIGAVEDGVKEAVRAYLRRRVYNKPKRITGECAFAEPPRIHADAGEYHAKVRIKLKIEEVRPYSAF